MKWLFLLSNLSMIAHLRSQCNQDYFCDEKNLGEIIFASVLFRHGDRGPGFTYPRDPYDLNRMFPNGLTQLTSIGMEQQFELGEFFRERYRNILPIKYNFNDIYVRSSDVDRCLQSATFNLQKFYPPIRKGNSEEVTFQAVPIHTAPFQKDKYLGVIPNCNKFYIDLYKLNSTEPLQCMAEKTRAIKEYVSRECDTGQFSSIIYDTLFIEELYNLTLPKWTISVYPENLRSLSLYSQYHLMALTRTQLKYSIGPLVDEIVSLMIDKQMGHLKPDRKLFMYSGHDSQVFNLLRALRVFNGLHVPYAAAVLIELRRAGDNHVVTVMYRNTTRTEPYLLRIPGCDTQCPLKTFVQLMKDLIPGNYELECAETYNDDLDTNFQVPLLGLPDEWQDCFD